MSSITDDVDLQIDEEKLSVKSMLEIHKKWRSILRIAKIKEQRDDIDWLTKNHVRQVGLWTTFFVTNSNALPII